MVVRAEEGWAKYEKMGWIVLSLVILFIEMNAISREKNRHDEETGRINYQAALQFAKVGKRLTDTDLESQHSFAIVEGNLTHTAKNIDKAARGVQEIYNEETGGDSYPMTMAASSFSEKGWILFVFVRGKYPLPPLLLNVKSHMQNHDTAWIVEQIAHPQVWEMPSLSAVSGGLSTPLSVSPQGEGDTYQIDFIGKHKKFTETLVFHVLTNGTLSQSYRITDGPGQVLCDSEKPKECRN